MVEFKKESMLNLEFHPLAELELDEASLFYNDISIKTSQRFLDDVMKNLKSIVE